MQRTPTFLYRSPTPVLCGVGVAKQVGEETRKLGAKTALLVTDPGVAGAGLVEPIKQSLAASGVSVSLFDQSATPPIISVLENCAVLMRELKPDLLVAVGGGSAMDTAKLAGMLWVNGGTVRDYIQGKAIEKPLPPLIALPTTSGTGSEVTWSAVFTDEATKLRHAFGFGGAEGLLSPTLAMVDPLLAQSMPPHIAAWTGMDALTHAIEGYTSPVAEPMTDALALNAIRLIADNLRPAVAFCQNLEALYNMAVAATMAGVVINCARVGLVHAMARSMTGVFNIHHGLANGMLLGAVMEFNLISNPPKFAEIARALGERVEGLSTLEAAQCAVDSLRQLAQDIGLPPSLQELGVKAEDVPRLTDDIMLNQVGLGYNPRMVNRSDVVRILEEVL